VRGKSSQMGHQLKSPRKLPYPACGQQTQSIARIPIKTIQTYNPIRYSLKFDFLPSGFLASMTLDWDRVYSQL
jgi:hypothetical protein